MRTNLIHGALLLVTLLFSSALTMRVARGLQVPKGPARRSADAGEAAATEVLDARGIATAVAPYDRIVSLSTIADHALLHLVEPRRLLAITGYTVGSHPEAWRFGDRAVIGSSNNLESVLALEPDLVIVSTFADDAFLTRLRERGIAVFDLGEMRGVETTRANILSMGALLDVRDRARRLNGRFRRELEALDSAIPDDRLEPGIYLSIYGDSLFGGTTGTSYADLLFFGGVRDLAEEAGFSEWPHYSVEELLELDPPLIVTLEGMATALREHSALSSLRACGPDGIILEVGSAYNSDAGLGLVEAAQELQDLLLDRSGW